MRVCKTSCISHVYVTQQLMTALALHESLHLKLAESQPRCQRDHVPWTRRLAPVAVDARQKLDAQLSENELVKKVRPTPVTRSIHLPMP